MSSIPDIINEEEQVYENLNTELHNWNIPKISTNQIYQTSWFDDKFKTSQVAKTSEQIYAITKQQENCALLSKESINQHISRGYKFLHIGLVQVAIKPLTRRGLNSSILLALRDGRFTTFSDSLLGLMESSLHNGPIHFDCYPDLHLSLNDKHILKALTLNLQTSGAITQMLEGSHSIALIYRVYYKCTKTNLNIHALVKSPKDKTILIQSSTTNANIQVPKTIQWNDIQLPNTWIAENENYPTNIQNDTVDIDYIQQYLD